MAACDSCGAALRPGAQACDLCGTPTEAADLDGSADPCAACGNRPPVGSSFCNVCGAPVAASARPPTPPVASGSQAKTSSAAGRRALTVAGLGALAVGVLWAVTVFSDAPAPDLAPPDTSEVGAAAPIPDATPPLADSLQSVADEFAALDTADGWYESGRYYLTAAFSVIQTDPVASVQFARRAMADFEQSLERRDEASVRIALAEAATIDPSNPMKPVEELRTVLAADPDNVDAMVLLAELRLRIGRAELAREGFERVLVLAPDGSLARVRAERGLAALDAP